MKINLAEYNLIRIAAASPELRLADVDFNVKQKINLIDEAVEQKASIIVFPELSITGYSCGDLFFQNELLNSAYNGLEIIRKYSKDKDIIIVFGLPLIVDNKLFNTAPVVLNGEILGIAVKTYIPNNNEFYEKRWFASALELKRQKISINDQEIPIGNNLIFKSKNHDKFTFGIEICEDLWAVKPISSNLAIGGANIILNLSASNEILGKRDYRNQLIASQSGRTNSIYVYTSASVWESTTDLVFAGNMLIYENGNLLAESERFSFESQVLIADCDLDKISNERLKNSTFLETNNQNYNYCTFYSFENEVKTLYRNISQTPFLPSTKEKASQVCEEIILLQSNALARRLKHINSDKVIIGISGGVDSTLALLVAYEAFNKLNLNLQGIYGISMPGFGTTIRTKSNAEKLAQKLGITYKVIPINNSTAAHFSDIGHSEEIKNVVYENAQARRRTHILMDLANEYNGIVVGTGDLSEIALGWNTFNADHISMYNVNASVPKTLIKTLIQWFAETKFDLETREILFDILDTPISPELLPANEEGKINQETEKIIGDYQLHDFFLYYGIRFGLRPKKVLLYAQIAFFNKFHFDYIKNTLLIFYERFFKNQFKRNCFTDGVKIGTVSLSPRGDWRMPSDASFNSFINEIKSIKNLY
jgi:NAD+ synthase (glutamine-hydrolysing)